MPLLIGLVVLVIVFGIGFMVLNQRRQTDTVSNRLAQFTERSMNLEDLELQLPFMQRVVTPILNNVFVKLGQSAKGNDKLRTNLMLAGNPGNLTPAMFTGMRIFIALALFGVIFLVCMLAKVETASTLQWSGIGGGLGFLLPAMWLGRQIKKRQKVILKALPDALDLLSISVTAGLGFDAALQRVAEKWDNELCREFRRALSDIRLGTQRHEAFRAMTVRTGVEDLTSFVSAVIQADQLGVSMGKMLKIQSDQLRLRRRQRAEEEAQKAPIKMLFPLVFLIFPSMFVVILGPAVPRLLGGGL
ncbi:type II secretion system F family protein [Herpetosiphon gulosus]|uniref:Type II secretion system protein GspF domain-containing protein n=1 Tax=Herpetosiphon gulosus TaxID=1973496 RepID=A0ABP9X2Q6_9CHLR